MQELSDEDVALWCKERWLAEQARGDIEHPAPKFSRPYGAAPEK